MTTATREQDEVIKAICKLARSTRSAKALDFWRSGVLLRQLRVRGTDNLKE